MSLYTEMEAIRKSARGMLHPQTVLDWARDNPDSALHKAFDWSDSEAAEKWRLEQARRIIRVAVVTIKRRNKTIRIRAYTMLKSDGRGYRATTDVVSDKELLDEALQQIENEITAWKVRYAHLRDLRPLLGSMSRAVKAAKTAKSKRKKAAA